MTGRLIVVDGTDGSGKETQTGLLLKAAAVNNPAVKKVEFPNYDDRSSALVKMYLSGELGDSPDSVNPYAASTFYAVDRYASYKKYWKDFLDAGGMVIADRYVTSNAIHQAAKLEGAERDRYLDWLFDFEYRLLELPAPDLVIFLDMPPEYSQRLLSKRYNNDEKKKDIHEKDSEFVKKSYRSAVYCAEKYGWSKISCVSDGIIKTPEQIHAEICAATGLAPL